LLRVEPLNNAVNMKAVRTLAPHYNDTTVSFHNHTALILCINFTIFLCGRPIRRINAHYVSCPSVCLSICLSHMGS